MWSLRKYKRGHLGNYLFTSAASNDPKVIRIEGDELQTDQDYELCLDLSNFMSDDIVTTRVTVSRSSKASPTVDVIPQGIKDLRSVPVSER